MCSLIRARSAVAVSPNAGYAHQTTVFARRVQNADECLTARIVVTKAANERDVTLGRKPAAVSSSRARLDCN
jgi:hypothetical protein